MKALTVQELIEELEKVKDKTLPVHFWTEEGDRIPVTYVDSSLNDTVDLQKA